MVEDRKTIDRILRQVDELKEKTERLEQLSRSEGPEHEQLYQNQVESVKRKLNELMRLTLLLNIEGLRERMTEYGPKAEEQLETFGTKVAEAVKSFMEAFKSPQETQEKGREGESETITRERAEELRQEYENLLAAGFSEAQAIEIIRARTPTK